LTSQRLALLVDRALSHLGSAFLLLLFFILAVAFTLGVFPRTILGVLLLIVVGGPILLIAEAIRDVHPVGGLIGLIVFLVLVWWWCARHAAFMHQHFF
jgi:hypothetical protein